MRRDQQTVKDLELSAVISEEQRRQLKMKADQASFELSKVRDEHQTQRNLDLRQIADFSRAKAATESIRQQLEAVNSELRTKVIELEQRLSRGRSPMPPQGPPPSSPLPPLPAVTITKSTRTPSAFRSNHTERSDMDHDPFSSAFSKPDISAVQAQTPEPVDQAVQQVMAERDVAVSDNEDLKDPVALSDLKVKQAVSMLSQSPDGTDPSALQADKLDAQRHMCENLTKDLQDARKTSESAKFQCNASDRQIDSKLRAHLEDARQETRRVSEDCKEHMEELSNRRARMSTLSEETGRHRDSLLVANEQLATLKAQLDRAVEQKVNKKLGQRLKVGPTYPESIL